VTAIASHFQHMAWPVDRLRDFGADRTLCAKSFLKKNVVVFSARQSSFKGTQPNQGA
jgi:hypothetical protein